VTGPLFRLSRRLKKLSKVSSSSVRVFYPELSPADIIRRLAERLLSLNEKLPLERVVLLGSYARGNYTASSGIDLLAVYRAEGGPTPLPPSREP
jgi:hypothetical protein